MKRRIFLGGVTLAFGAACSMGGGELQADPKPALTRSYDLEGLEFSAREGITVSEGSGYYPFVDVVWRGDPPGPRIPQIGAMFQEAAARNKSVLTGTTPVVVEILLRRFHGVTERTRASIGGVYHIVFDLSVRHARSGAVLEPARTVVGTLDAPGGVAALRLDTAGQTEKVRVTDFLTGLLRQQLT